MRRRERVTKEGEENEASGTQGEVEKVLSQ